MLGSGGVASFHGCGGDEVGGGDELVVMSKEGNNEQAWDGDRQ
jgi:hypothetical protein